ncbi:acyltransferase-like protein [Mucilaginibacter gracilis]|uniref:Acyltransferase-like protein n=1 Tax=Mucilaginibacter gracilis TaxID=423350 RepID=A0A495JBA4_9SPHI|nr:acyltransferase [Mucilaginibacter gracilis]RKR85674.1 acyltransferase-like protein [Mucilaginibacter gracilis]
MQNLTSSPPVKRNYDFVDTIRCIAMIFIVMEHSTYFEPDKYLPTLGLRAFFFFLSIQFSKFGTVCFFLLAGFLIGDKFTDYTPGQYLKRRLDSTIVPWLFWSVFFIVLINFNLIHAKILGHPDPAGVNVYQTLINSVTTTYLYTNYWFIPNFLFCITLLLIFKRHLYSYKFGAVLFAFTLFYSINIYFSWIRPSHTVAIFGFVFFLWLGAQIHKNWQKVNDWIDKTSLAMWVILTVFTLGLSMAEMYLLRSLGVHDPYNTLRFSNVLYSLSFFFMLLKIRDFKFIHYLKPRETTYGIYLIHYVMVSVVMTQITDPLNLNIYQLSVPVILLFQLAKFIMVYGLTLITIWLINVLHLKRLIGR